MGVNYFGCEEKKTFPCLRFSTGDGDPLVHLASNPVFMPNFPGWAFFKVPNDDRLILIIITVAIIVSIINIIIIFIIIIIIIIILALKLLGWGGGQMTLPLNLNSKNLSNTDFFLVF